MVKLEADHLRDLGRAGCCEWLLADGLGGYASSTVVGLNTRRYHGLLVVATQPPVRRMVLLSKLEETLILDGVRHELGTNAYPGAVHPRGFERALSFALDPLPTLVWEVEGCRLGRTVARVHDEPATVIVYVYEADAPASLELRPLLAYRDHHALQHENDAVRREVEWEGRDLVLRPYDGCPSLRLRVPRGAWEADGHWYRRFEYERERERGLEFCEDLFSPGLFRLSLLPGEPVSLLAWAGPIPAGLEAGALVSAERRRLRELAGGTPDPFLAGLRRAADAFLVRRGEKGRSVIAGYPWFADWGRDSMISLPGLCLATHRFADARAVLGEYARHVDGGMLPNRFPDTGEPPQYDTVDAALWMIVAVQRYLEATGDREFVRSRLKDAVFAVLDGYRDGTRHGIRMMPSGLITQGGPGLKLTWMDARVGEWVVTPRAGQPVEIQGLWYNALLFGASLALDLGDSGRAAGWKRLAARVRESFLEAFWSEDLGYLADVVGGGARDLSLRPNQLFAIGLPHSLLARDKAARVLDAVKASLLTPRGLRTLAPSDPAYRVRYEGDRRSRDGAYHQGTVWPYLTGIYFDASIRVHGEPAKQEAREWLRGFACHLEEAGLGYVSEVFDGDPPHLPGGAIAQAWSVAELLRVATRLTGKPPATAPREAAESAPRPPRTGSFDPTGSDDVA